MATRAMARERADHTLQATALLHEAWLRLVREEGLDGIADRDRLIMAAARAMRQVLVDHDRHRKAGKRGGGMRRVPLDDVLDGLIAKGVDVQAVHEALDDLARAPGQGRRQATVMTLRIFGRFSVKEVAEQLDVCVGTVENDYRRARAWLHRRLGGGAR